MNSQPRFRKAFTLLELLVVLTITCGARAADEHPIYPTNFLAAAKAFTNAPANNRYNEACALDDALPKPTFTGAGYKERGSRFSHVDKPTFVLRESEVVRLLGNAYYTNSTSYFYLAWKAGNSRSALMVNFLNGYVVSSTIVGRFPTK
jgi:prepilin-type N-terminal cleavage/methylation domain-containing protein